MRKNLLIALAVLIGLVMSMTACILGEDIDKLEVMASKANLGKTVDIAGISGVTVPANLMKPVTSITKNAQYTGTVEWSSNDDSNFKNANSTFQFGKTYKATITLTAEKGYTLHLVKANFFTVAGASKVSNDANSGVITAEFPSTPAAVINIAAIQGVTVPVPGATPVTSVTANAQYTGTVSWSPAVSGTFASDTIYTAAITLTPKSGYTLQGVTANFFTVAGTTSKSNSANSGVITATFPRTDILTPANMIEYYWVDQHDSLVTSSGGVTSITTGSSLTITPQTPSDESYVVKKWFVNGVDTGQTGNTYIFSVSTIGNHIVDLFLEKNGKLYSTSITITVTHNVLSVATWAEGSFASSKDEQWFKFTATSSTQYIHASFGTLNSTSSGGVNVQLYDSNGSTVGSQSQLYSSNTYISRSVTSGQTYYIKVTPYSSSNYTGTYQIVFNASSTPPLLTNSATATELTAGTWTDGTLSSSVGEQWFKFTATTSNYQYIHVNFGTLSSSYGLYVQVYNSSGSTVVSQTTLSSIYGTYTYFYPSTGNVYYIKVTPYSSYYTGTYQIAFNTSSNAPMPSNATELTANTWANGSLTSSGGVQWFKFTATSSTQYIHVSFGTLNDLYVQVYDSTGSTVGSQTELWSSTRYISRTVTSGQMYYIKVTPYYSSYTGTYQIAFNTSSTAPSTSGSGTASGSEGNPISLTNGTWASGNITSTASGTAVWYSFNVTSGTTYRVWWDDTDNGGGTLDVRVAAYYGNGNYIFDSDSNYEYFTANQTGTVKLKVYPLSSGSTGSFRVVYSTSSTRPY